VLLALISTFLFDLQEKNTFRSDVLDLDRSAPALIPPLADGSALAFHKAEEHPHCTVPDQFATVEKHPQSSGAQATPLTTASQCRLPEHLKRKLGTKSCSLATAVLLHFRFVPSLLHTLKKGSSNSNSNPHHITPATSS